MEKVWSWVSKQKIFLLYMIYIYIYLDPIQEKATNVLNVVTLSKVLAISSST